MPQVVLITGASGHIGRYLLATAPADFTVVALAGRRPLPDGVRGARVDLADAGALTELLDRVRPEIIIHTAAIATVEDCEADRARALAVNVGATRMLAQWSSRRQARLLYTSTDLVFSGEHGPYAADAEPAPLMHYGETKWRGELAVREMPGDSGCVVRCALNYGWGPPGNPHYAEQLVSRLVRGEPLQLFTDQFRSFIHTADTAAGIWRLVQAGAGGIWHLGGPDRMSRYDFAVAVARRLGVSVTDERLRPIRMRDLDDFQPRPRDCSLLVQPLPGGFMPAGLEVGLTAFFASRNPLP